MYIFLLLIIMQLANVNLMKDFVFSAKQDLNSDKKPDTITLKQLEQDLFVLKVNDQSVKVELEEPCEGFIVVDIDPSDSYKEIGVRATGPSDDDVVTFYWYDGKKLHYLDKLRGYFDSYGQGAVYFSLWQGCWAHFYKYTLNYKKGTLDFVDQDLYFINQEHKVLEKFDLMQFRNSSKKLETIIVGEKVTLVACDKAEAGDNSWCLVTTSKRISGWVPTSVIHESLDVGCAD